MSKIKIVSFATTKKDVGFSNFYPHLIRLYISARKFGYDDFSFWNREKIKNTDFYKENQEILDQKRGAGYWAWKPYIILEELNKLQEGDILIYMDSANYFIKGIEPLIELAKKNNGFYFEEQRFEDKKLKYWTKRDCFYYMDADNKEFHDTYIRQAGFIILENKSNVVNLINEWLNFSKNKQVITDIENNCNLPNLNDFIDHRHDQSIFSILMHKYMINGFRPPTQWGNNFKPKSLLTKDDFIDEKYNIDYTIYPESTYDTLLIHDKVVSTKYKILQYFINLFKEEKHEKIYT
jgi:hypothetical protein